MSRKIAAVIVVVLIVGGFLILGQESEGSQEITVGAMMPLTGDAAPFGKNIKKGIEFAEQEIDGPEINIVYEDTKCKGKESAKAMRKLVSVDNAVSVIGEACSGATLAAAPIANRKKVPLISPASTSPKISDAGNYTFRTIPSDQIAAEFSADLIANRGHERLAILYSNEDYGLGYSNALEKAFENMGNEVVSSQAFKRKTTDVRSQVSKAKQADPDAVFIVSNSPASSIAVLRQIEELGMDVKLFGSEGLKSPKIVGQAVGPSEGLTVVSTSKGTGNFIQRYNRTYGEEPGLFTAQAYDAYKAISLAIQNGATTSEEIEDQLRKISFQGATGEVSFDKNGDVQGGFKVFEARNGSFVETGK